MEEKPKGGRLKCRYCEYRAPNPTEILHHVQAQHPGWWNHITHKAKVKSMALEAPKDTYRKQSHTK